MEHITLADHADERLFLSLAHLLNQKISVGTLATAIEEEGVYTWDRFGRFGLAKDEDRSTAFSLLAAMHAWAMDPDVQGSADPRSPLELAEDYQSPDFCIFGWPVERAPNFEKIRLSQSELESRNTASGKRKAPDKFVAALVKLLIVIAKRDRDFNIDKMPGTKPDFHAVAIKYDQRLDLAFDTFDTYIRSFCKFKQGSRPSDYYRKLFPEYFK